MGAGRYVGFTAGDRITWHDQVGVVLSVNGEIAEVAVPAGQVSVHQDELAHFRNDPGGLLEAGQLGASTAYRLLLRGAFLEHAYRFDPLAGLSNARVEPKHHQVYVAHRVTRKAAPRMILADEVGLGKTIEAGLILKELRARRTADRTLILVPANLMTQWQQELRVKFNEDFTILDGDAAKHFGRDGSNPFAASDSLIASLPFASRERRVEEIAELEWDLVIFDEAHRVRFGKQRRTRAYQLAEQLRDHIHGLLLLTATPMQLGVHELWGLIDLVEPGLYPSVSAYDRERRQLPHLNELMRAVRDWPTLADAERDRVIRKFERQLDACGLDTERIAQLDQPPAREIALDRIADRHPLGEVLVRNRRVDVGGFTSRTARRIMVTATPEEEEAREAVTAYLRNTYNLAKGGNNALGFLLVTYHKMLASSSAAIHHSLRRRHAELSRQLKLARDAQDDFPSINRETRHDVLEMDDATSGLDGVRSVEVDLETELIELDAIIGQLGKLRDSKARQLIEIVDRILTDDPEEKVLVFTQFHQTQRLLELALRTRGFSVEMFNGRQTVTEKDAAIERFRRGAQVLISTEAGGEGRNLQFCHVMVNFDLPWNPMRVEQRIGRVDRIGQERPVVIYNLAVEGTIEQRVLDVLAERIRVFEESVGSLDPILGTVESDIEDLVLLPDTEQAAAFDKLEHDLERKVKQAVQTQEQLHDFAMERNSFRRDETNRLLGQRTLASDEDLRTFVADALDYEGGTLAEEVDGRTSVTLSPALARQLRIREHTHRGTFSSQVAVREESWDFFAMGHSLIDALLDHIRADASSRAGIREVDDAPRPVGVEVLYELVADGAHASGRLIRHLIGPALEVRSQRVDRQFDGRDSTRDVSPPTWLADALAASRARANEELGALRDEVRGEYEDLRSVRLERAERLANHRIRQNEERRQRRLEQIGELVAEGDASQQRIIPMWRSQVRKWQADNEAIEAELADELQRIRTEQPKTSLRMVAAGLVVAP